MPGIVENYIYLRVQLYQLIVKYGPEKLQSVFCIIYGVERLNGSLAASGVLLALPFRVLLVNIRTVL